MGFFTGQQEDVYLFFFACKNYVNARKNLFELLFNRLEKPIIIKFGFFEVVSLLKSLEDLINN